MASMKHAIKFWYLRNHQFFSQLNEDEIVRLCVITNFKQAIKNELITFDHDHVDRIYLLKRGMIKIIRMDEEGKENVQDIVQEGDLFGEIISETQETNQSEYTEYARVMSDKVAICSFTLQDFERVLAANPEISIKYTKKVGDKYKTLRSRYNDLVFKDVRMRLINFLLKFVKNNGKKQDNTLKSPNFLTHQDIADLIGATRQTVTSILLELKQENKVLYSRAEITIPDFRLLK